MVWAQLLEQAKREHGEQRVAKLRAQHNVIAGAVSKALKHAFKK